MKLRGRVLGQRDVGLEQVLHRHQAAVGHHDIGLLPFSKQDGKKRIAGLSGLAHTTSATHAAISRPTASPASAHLQG